MRAAGGSVKKREDGGRATISADSLRAARDEREKAEDKLTRRNVNSGLAALNTGVAMLPGIGRGLRLGNAALAGSSALGALGNTRARNAHLREADRIERGQVTPGEEDRKSGGRVKGKKC
jgi:hypothetical protein